MTFGARPHATAAPAPRCAAEPRAAASAGRPPLRSLSGLAAVAVGLAGGCSSPPPLGTVPTELIELADRASPTGRLDLRVDRDGLVRTLGVEVPVADLPTLVREAALAAERGATLVGAKRGLDQDGPVWEVQVLQEGRRVALLLAGNGHVREIERELRRDEVPRSVLQAADAAVPGGMFARVAILHRGRTTEYHLEKERGGAVFRVVVSAEGEPKRVVRAVDAEVEVPLDR